MSSIRQSSFKVFLVSSSELQSFPLAYYWISGVIMGHVIVFYCFHKWGYGLFISFLVAFSIIEHSTNWNLEPSVERQIRWEYLSLYTVLLSSKS